MKPCTKALYVSLISRCDSAAIVSNTSELLPEPDTPVNTVSRRLGSSTLTSLRLFTRAPCTRIRSWLSAACCSGDGLSALVALVIVSPSVGRGAGRRRLPRAVRFRQHFSSSIVGAAGARVVPRIGGSSRTRRCNHGNQGASGRGTAVAWATAGGGSAV